jgi:competence protein ComEA
MSDLDAPARPVAPEAVPFLDRLQQWRRDPRVAAAVIVAVVLAAFVVWTRTGSDSVGSAPRAAGSVSTVPAPTTTTPPRALVHVVGAVRAPGVVELDAGARVRDALAAAGGPADDADVERLNLAAPITDGERLAVPRIGEPAPVPLAGETTPSAGAPAGPLDLNAATATDLETLPGIGPTLAEAIVRQREKMGRFTSVDDLKQVRGIGEGRFADIRELVRV